MHEKGVIGFCFSVIVIWSYLSTLGSTFGVGRILGKVDDNYVIVSQFSSRNEGYIVFRGSFDKLISSLPKVSLKDPIPYIVNFDDCPEGFVVAGFKITPLESGELKKIEQRIAQGRKIFRRPEDKIHPALLFVD